MKVEDVGPVLAVLQKKAAAQRSNIQACATCAERDLQALLRVSPDAQGPFQSGDDKRVTNLLDCIYRIASSRERLLALLDAIRAVHYLVAKAADEGKAELGAGE